MQILLSVHTWEPHHIFKKSSKTWHFATKWSLSCNKLLKLWEAHLQKKKKLLLESPEVQIMNTKLTSV